MMPTPPDRNEQTVVRPLAPLSIFGSFLAARLLRCKEIGEF